MSEHAQCHKDETITMVVLKNNHVNTGLTRVAASHNFAYYVVFLQLGIITIGFDQ